MKTLLCKKYKKEMLVRKNSSTELDENTGTKTEKKDWKQQQRFVPTYRTLQQFRLYDKMTFESTNLTLKNFGNGKMEIGIMSSSSQPNIKLL